MDDSHKERLQLLPIADTIGGTAARENPRRTLDHYNHLANQLWLSSKVSDVADGVFLRVQQGYTAWGKSKWAVWIRQNSICNCFMGTCER